jgi:hypothetical protein
LSSVAVAQFALGLSTGDSTMAETFALVARFLPGLGANGRFIKANG